MVILVIAGKEERQRVSSALSDQWQLRLADDESLSEEENLSGDLVLLSLRRRDEEMRLEVEREARRLRENAPVLALLPRDHAWDFDSPAPFDDFIYDDFDPEELRARVWQLLYRHRLVTGRNLFTVRELSFDFDRYEVYFKGRPLELTFKEYELLRFLATHPGKVFTREMLLEQVWGYGYYGGSRTVDVHIRRLRAKIDSPDHQYIGTVRGAGYLFEP
jgi:DNA-binding response OmpR family regulator